MELIDSHAHIDFPQFDTDRDAMLARARAGGVSTILAIGVGPGPEKLDAAIPLAEAHEWIYTTVGVHPHEAKEVAPEHLETLEKLAKHPKVIAWGEIGLDYYYDHSPRDVQQSVFVQQMELAGAAMLPIVIHCRPSDNSEDAWDDCLRLLDEQWATKGIGGVLHCFTGNWTQAKRALEMGFMISFAGNVTFPKAQQIRDAALEVPLDHMFIETDSPYLAPIPYRGKRNEPAYVKETARKIGELRGLSMEGVGEQTARNFYNFFKISEITESKVPTR